MRRRMRSECSDRSAHHVLRWLSPGSAAVRVASLRQAWRSLLLPPPCDRVTFPGVATAERNSSRHCLDTAAREETNR